jgi:hypothetical protein
MSKRSVATASVSDELELELEEERSSGAIRLA